MSTPTLPPVVTSAMTKGDCLRMVLSRRRRSSGSDDGLKKITVRPVTIRGELKYQWALRIGSQERHENLTPAESVARIQQLFGREFSSIHLCTTDADHTVRLTAKDRLQVTRSKPSMRETLTAHDRSKSYLIPEGKPCPFLVELGIMTPDGRVRKSRFAKFRQVNRFLELVSDALSSVPRDRCLRVVDYGCGKSYLTFAIHHLLTEIRGQQAEITGLDLKADVIADCRQIAKQLGLDGIEFRQGEIADAAPTEPVDLAVSLHACDTATDDAIAAAIRWHAQVILVVPCCQHEVAGRISTPEFAAVHEHGILKDRWAALMTDTLRAQLLKLHGYRTQVVEFIDMEHTAKNVLIRAVKRADAASNHDDADWENYRQFKTNIGLDTFHLESALGLVESSEAY